MMKRFMALLLAGILLVTIIPATAEDVITSSEIVSEEALTVVAEPTAEPTAEPEVEPTAEPEVEPTAEPEVEPTAEPEVVVEPEVEPLTVEAATSDLYGYVGEKNIAISIAVAGGTAPYQISVAGNAEAAQTLSVEAAGVVDFTYVPAQAGEHEIVITVTDADGASAASAVSVPVAGKDADNADSWMRDAEDIELTGEWAEDIVAIAASQLGYAESSVDFIIDEEGKHNFSIYGDSCGRTYSEWSAIFVEWVLETAEIDAKDYPRAHTAKDFAHKIDSADAYEEDGYVPAIGDIAFLDVDTDGEIDSAAIVSSASSNAFKAIAGDCEGAVATVKYDLDDDEVVGFANTAALIPAEEIADDAEPVEKEAPVVEEDEIVEDEIVEDEIVEDEIVEDEEVVAASAASVLGVWYDLCFEDQPINIYITTDLSAEYVEMYMGNTKLAGWSASEATITENAYNKEWLVTYTFEESGNYYLWYQASSDGQTMGASYMPNPVNIERPALIGVWYDQTIEAQPTHIHVTTNLDVQYLELHMGDTMLDSWSATDADVTITEYATCKDWTVTYTFAESGPYYLWYKASKDGVNMELPFAPADPLIIERPAIIGVWYADTVENALTTLCVTTNLDMQYLYLYLGSDVIASWNINDEGVSITEYATCKDWTVNYTFTEPGAYYLWYKASADGVNMENAYTEPDPVIIKRPAIINTWYESANAGEPLPMHITTNLDMNYIELYEGSTLLASWSTADEGISIDTYATCKDWNVTYIFETAGEHYLWYKATSDGVTEEIPYGDGAPVIIGESTTLVTGDFQYKVNSDASGIIITKYVGSDASVTVPATVDNLPVVEIGDKAFEGNTALTSIDLPDSVQVIGVRAFADCTNLASMN